MYTEPKTLPLLSLGRGFLWLLIVSILYLSVFFFGGVHPPAIFLVRSLIIIGLLCLILFVLSERDFLKDFHPFVLLPLFFSVLFVFLALWQYQAGGNILSSSFVGTVYRQATSESALQFIFYIIFFLLCLKMFSKRAWIIRFITSICFLTFLITLIAIVQRLSGTDQFLGVFQSPSGQREVAEFFGPFINENHFGGFLGLTLPLILATMDYRFSKFKSSLPFTGHPRGRLKTLTLPFESGFVFLFFLMVLTVAGCFLSTARTSFIVIPLTALLYMFFRKQKSFFLSLLFLILAAAASIALILFVGRGEIFSHFYFPRLFEGGLERLALSRDSLGIFHDYSLFGIGLGAFKFISLKYVSMGADSYLFAHVHNDYLELLVEGGVVGFSLFFLMVASILFFAARSIRTSPSRWSYLMMLQSFIAVLNIAVMEFTDFHLKTPANALLLIMQLALIFRISYSNKTFIYAPGEFLPPKKSFWAKTILSASCILLAVFLFIHSFQPAKAYFLTQLEENKIENLKEAAKSQPLNAQFQLMLGKEYWEEAKRQVPPSREMAEKALVHFKKAVKLCPTFASYWFILGKKEYAANYRKEGLKALDRAAYWAPARSGYLLYLLAHTIQESERASNREERNYYLNQAKELYQKILTLKLQPLPEQYEKWMSPLYYQRLQQLIEGWNA